MFLIVIFKKIKCFKLLSVAACFGPIMVYNVYTAVYHITKVILNEC